MKKQLITVLVKVQPTVIVKGSTRGCGRRYVVRCHTAQGKYLHIATNPTSPSNFSCDLHTRAMRILRVALRRTDEFGGIADGWDDSRSCGTDLEAAFAHEQAQANTEEQNHGQ